MDILLLIIKQDTMTGEEKIKALKQSLIENIENVQSWIEDPRIKDRDFHWHVGFKCALKEVLQAIEEAGD